MIRTAVINGEGGKHITHCFNLLRQAILCAADTTLDPMKDGQATDGLNVTHVCRDWTQVYAFVTANQLSFPAEDWRVPSNTTSIPPAKGMGDTVL